MSRILVRPLARRDISEAAEYLARQSRIELAERFLDSVITDLQGLSKMPQMGALCGFRNQETRDIRRWPVSGFERWLIFYKPLEAGIDVARVLHGAQDLNWIFD